MTFIADTPLVKSNDNTKPSDNAKRPLYQLPKTGDFIQLSSISSIRAVEPCHDKPIGIYWPPFVRLIVAGQWYTLECESFDEAKLIRDQIAQAQREEIEQ